MGHVTSCSGALILKPFPSDLINKSPGNKPTRKSLFPAPAFSKESLREKMPLLRLASVNQGLDENLILKDVTYAIGYLGKFDHIIFLHVCGVFLSFF